MKFTVLGGGISGLAAAHYLSKFHTAEKIVLVEAANRLGGWIRTSRHADGILYEDGPRTIRVAGMAGANTLEMIEELGLADRLVPIKSGHPTTKNRLVLVDSKLHALPSSAGSIFFRQKPFSKPLIMAGLKDLWSRPKICDDDSIYDFVSRRFGEDVAMYAIDPLVRGICAGDAKKISADAFVTTELFRLEQQYGGVLKGALLDFGKKRNKSGTKSNETSELVSKAKKEKWNLWSLKGGLQTLTEALEEHLLKKGVQIEKNTRAQEIQVDQSSSGLVLKTSNGDFCQDHIISTLPAFASAELIKDIGSLTVARDMLKTIPYVDVAVVNIEFSGNVLKMDPAFGFLVPSNQKEPILGVIFNTCSFPQGDRTILTAMMGGAWFEELFGTSPSLESLEKIALEHVTSILKLGSVKPTRICGQIHRKCIPQYTIGHRSRVSQAKQCIKDTGLPLSLCGSAYEGVGVNDSMMSAKLKVLEILSKI